MSERKERPILMSAPMVRALLDGRKTMTRRGAKVINEYVKREAWEIRTVEGRFYLALVGAEKPIREVFCPYGVPGDRLWVKESWFEEWDEQCKEFDPPRYRYRATETEHCIKVDGDGFTMFNRDGSEASPWRSPRFMPRAASRLTLEVTGVRVERVQEISEADARAEGAEKMGQDSDGKFYLRDDGSYRIGYAGLWAHLNGAESWEANPWVWVLTLTVVPQGPDAGVRG